ncbi:alginate lyase family protein [Mucilaginibacter terrae]|uniref:alginate lyase family protein n=1 Tax=Mucilaginibacter terrae TaxID=1955052 RepID=UPI0036330DA6
MKQLTIILILLITTVFVKAQSVKQFIHPGILHTQSSLQLIKEAVKAGEQPWKDGFKALASNELSGAYYKLQGPFDSVSRDATRRLHSAQIEHDSNAAYYNALMWALSGKKAHAQKAIEILNAWSYGLKAIVYADAPLLAAFDGSQLVNAAEILRYTGAGWKPEDIAQCEKMFKEVFYPVMKDFAPYANGNWGNAAIKAIMGIGVFCNDRAIFDSAVDYYYNGKGNASLPNYIYETGQCQESGRDQAHAQLGLGNLAEACEIGYNQGLDMYGALNNRLLIGFEYTAKYNLGVDVPYTMHPDVNNKYRFTKISDDHRGDFRPIYEMVYNHYVNRKNLPAPYTAKVVSKIRPENEGPRPADQAGFGTLLFNSKNSNLKR